ncbi:MAG: futalosine hydrolase [Prevotellaceae bacterium]|jgi:futalosine hydrolase|nr:futalosine hydrolase [Prevotellaceae bacterium]
MKILITAATDSELQAAREAAAASANRITTAVTGIGIAATAYHTTKLLAAQDYDLAINTGIAGSFTDRLAVGSVACPVIEYFGDSGVQTPAGFSTLFDEQLLGANTFPFIDGALRRRLPAVLQAAGLPFPPATGVTVQMASGAQPRIDALQRHFCADIETMESAAFFYVCLSEHVPFVALRAISNRVEVRRREAWNIPLAMRGLHRAIRELLLLIENNIV